MSIRNPFLKELEDEGVVISIGDHEGRKKQTADTVADARAKAVKLLRANLDYARYGLGEKPLPCYWQTGHTFKVGVRYSNTILKGCLDDGDFYDGVKPEHLLRHIEAAIWEVENGNADAAIQKVLDANKARVTKILAKKALKPAPAVVPAPAILSDYEPLVQRMAAEGKEQA